MTGLSLLLIDGYCHNSGLIRFKVGYIVTQALYISTKVTVLAGHFSVIAYFIHVRYVRSYGSYLLVVFTYDHYSATTILL